MRLLTAGEVGERWQVPATWVLREAREGRLACIRLGRYVRFSEEAISAYEADLEGRSNGAQRVRRLASNQAVHRSGKGENGAGY
jgi:excisionase family DNA binding protein